VQRRGGTAGRLAALTREGPREKRTLLAGHLLQEGTLLRRFAIVVAVVLFLSGNTIGVEFAGIGSQSHLCQQSDAADSIRLRPPPVHHT